MNDSQPIFTVRGLSKAFGRKQVLRDLDFELVRGKTTVLLGENGAGKSTLLSLALGALQPDSGSLSVLGFDPSRKPRPVREAVGFVPSVPDAYDWMDCAELFRFLAPQYPKWNRELVDQLSKRLRLPRNQRFEQMSRGEGMKAMLVAALAPEPELLLLDEPFGGLDPLVREEVLGEILGEIAADGRTILLTTHELESAARIADRIAVLRDGRIAEHGSAADLLGTEEVRPRQLHQLMAGGVR